MIEDAELLRRYVCERSQDAFTELVRRRIDLVYSVALRHVGGDVHFAEDVTQKVFADLARKAPSLLGRPVLSGWLYRSAQFASSDMVRSERRRRAREQETHAMQEITSSADPATDWDRIRPLLDEAMGELNDSDRDAVALRFFDGRAFADIGRALQLTEEAARKRVDRALDKMAAILSRRGMISTSAALGIALANHASVAAPAGLVASVTTSSLAAAVLGGGATAGAGGAAFFGASVMAKIGFGVLGAAAIVATGAALYEARELKAGRVALASAGRERDALRAQVRNLEARAAAEQRRADSAEEDAARLLSAIEKAGRGSQPQPAAPRDPARGEITRDVVEARYKRAQDLARGGNWAAALPELLWCFDEGMLQVSSFSGERVSLLLNEIVRIAEHYPPALTALRDRRDRVEQRILANPADADAVAHEFASLNRVLGEDPRTLDLYDRLPAADPRRRSLVLAGVYQMLVEARRYPDAVQAVPYERMTWWFERESHPPNVAGERYPEMTLKDHRRRVVVNAVKNVEVLAGAGDLQHAREFARQMLAFDASSETRDLLQRHAARAGHPQLLQGLPKM